MVYSITEHTRQQARRIGVEVRPSKREGKKIDVLRDGERIASVGATGYGDYGTFLRTEGKEYANERRRLYKKRHSPHRLMKGTPSYYASELLW